MKFKPSFRDKRLVVFDLDGTLTETKSVMDAEMARLFARLLATRPVAVIGGGKYALFRRQLIKRLHAPKALLEKLFLFPTTATSFYCYQSGWKNVYRHELSKRERVQIKRAFEAVFSEMGYEHPKKTYGTLIEDRGTQVSFSVFGQDIVKALGERGVRIKKAWARKNRALKMEMARRVARRLPRLEVRAAGYTTVDVTRKGIDKAYGIKQIEKYLRIPRAQMVFIGDALFKGGNDYAAKKTGVACVAVKGPKETKKFIRLLLNANR